MSALCHKLTSSALVMDYFRAAIQRPNTAKVTAAAVYNSPINANRETQVVLSFFWTRKENHRKTDDEH